VLLILFNGHSLRSFSLWAVNNDFLKIPGGQSGGEVHAFQIANQLKSKYIIPRNPNPPLNLRNYKYNLLRGRKNGIQNSRETHAALHQQLLNEPILLDFPRILGRVELEVLLSRRPPSKSIVLLVGVVRGELWVVEFRRPHDAAVERLDGFGPRVGAERVRVARRRRASPLLGLAARRRRRAHEHLLRLLQLELHGHELELGSGRAREPRVDFGAPAAALLVLAESLPVDATDVGVVDGAAEGGLEGGRADRFGVFGGCQSDALGDERIVPNGVEF